jgi:hypothetical protein
MVAAMMTRDSVELAALRDGAFEIATAPNGQGTLISSSINGSAFTFSMPGSATLTPMQVTMIAQLALDHKCSGFARPTTKTTVRFL